MKIILTHEQTDFDGLASLLGAYLLDESSVPILPRRMNRNVRAFLTLYGVNLPFVDPRDMIRSEITEVTLVDTQALASIKGMGPQTKVKVIDHHSPKKDLPENWEVVSQETGANTTIFVDSIEQQGIHLNVIQATLLMLGIYEDTGSLTYTRTKPRDIRAAAYLLEQGASLAIAHNFINHPLSLKQQEIYDQLRQDAQTLEIHGHTVIVTQGSALGTDEELSTIAHKMRDLLDPEALILLVDIRGGVQLIARSTSDLIDVSKIAEYFGGGGHKRAAAALIKTQDRKSVLEELNKILHESIKPGITVGDIMSGKPQIVSPDSPIQEVADLMQRFGFEGYPVVENDDIVGLVTRRAIDRATTHKLNLTAAHVMDAGNIHIHPDHGIEYLQNLMTDTGWGQIPVVHRDDHSIIGIVTRTDLLNTLAPHLSDSDRRNLSDNIRSALPPARLALLKDIADVALNHRISLFIVGGFVRDLLLGLPSLDFDIVVEGNAIELARSVQAKYGGRITTHKRFGTAKWFLDREKYLKSLQLKNVHPHPESSTGVESHLSYLPETLDFITARREFYTHPTALPTVESGSIKLDLHRRDFTINTLAIRLDGLHYGDLHDYWGGFNDIRQGLVRVLHSLSFIDDPTRILRAIRYEKRYEFSLGKRTKQLLISAIPLIERVSGDRIRHEIDKILTEKNKIRILDRLHELGILKAIHPDLIWDDWISAQISNSKDPLLDWELESSLKGISLNLIVDYTLWLMRLPPQRAKKVTKRLRLPSITDEAIQSASRLWVDLPNLKNSKPSVWTSRLDKVPTISIYSVFIATDNINVKENLKSYISKWKYVTQITTGHDLESKQLSPGPVYKEILTRLRYAWLDGEIKSEEDELTLLESIFEEISD